MKRLGISYDQLFHAIPGFYLVIQSDTPHFTIIEVSNSLARFFHQPRAGLIDRSFRHIFTLFPSRVPQTTRDALSAGLFQVIATQKPCDLGIISYSKSKNHPLMWRTVLHPIVHAGVVTGITLAFDGLTPTLENQARDEQIQRLEHLIEINKSKDEFISIASHQLRTPATAVKQYLGMLRDGMFGELPELQAEILKRAYDNNERQLSIVTDLLKVAQVDGGKVALRFEDVDMGQLVGHVIEDSKELFNRRSQTVRYRSPQSPVVVSVDPDTMRMVLENILDNASKYSPEKSEVSVNVRELKHSVKIAIKDQGVGVSYKEQSKLFEKFSRIENIFSTKVGGTGLGLYWAKRVIDLHGGSIAYRPNIPKGSVFEIILPRS